jgi:hypothetical protein
MMETGMRKGDLVRTCGIIQLYPDTESFVNPDGTSGIILIEDDHMVVLGKAKYRYIRVLHPVHGARRVHRNEVRLVQTEACNHPGTVV